MLYSVMEQGNGAPAEEYLRLFELAEPRLRRALIAGFGAGVGREAAVVALGWAWQHSGRLSAMDNPVGYLYRVGETAARRLLEQENRQRTLVDALVENPERTQRDHADAQLLGLELSPALDALSVQQRTAVVLVHGYGIPLREVAETMQISVATVREHAARAIRHLRTELEVHDADRC